jgi:hydroxymethylbilane synthase
VPITTQGDVQSQTLLSEIGGKGIFIRSLEQALLDETIDIAVHSLKDVTATILEGLTLSGFLKAETVADALIFHPTLTVSSLEELPKNPVIATGSLRRQVQLKRLRPDVVFENIRGNIDTRLEKLNQSSWSGIMLSAVGLRRLQLNPKSQIFHPSVFIPAPGQGVIALETRKEDGLSNRLSQGISNPEQSLLSSIELSFLYEVGLDCRYPLGLYAEFLSEHHVQLSGFIQDEKDEDIEIFRSTWFVQDAIKEAALLGKKWKQER